MVASTTISTRTCSSRTSLWTIFPIFLLLIMGDLATLLDDSIYMTEAFSMSLARNSKNMQQRRNHFLKSTPTVDEQMIELQEEDEGLIEEERMSSTSGRRMQGRLTSNSSSSFAALTLPQVPDPTADPGDDFYRWAREKWPRSVLHFIRDSGLLRWIQDTPIFVGLPFLMKEYPQLLPQFIQLSSRERLSKEQYGTHPSQFVELLENKNNNKSVFKNENNKVQDGTATRPEEKDNRKNNLIIFCHGGAWSSGAPWMYRMVAETFFLNSEENNSSSSSSSSRGTTVAIWGHRTYPDATVQGQVEDLYQCVDYLHEKDNWNSVTVVGHSSGGHVALLAALLCAREEEEENPNNIETDIMEMLQEGEGRSRTRTTTRKSQEPNGSTQLLQQRRPQQQQQRNKQKLCDRLIAISSPFDIPQHFEWETARGVEEISALQPACGYTMKQWIAHSPRHIIQNSIATLKNKPGRSSPSSTSSSSISSFVATRPNNNTDTFFSTPSSSAFDNHTMMNVDNLPKILLIHGGADTVVPFTSSLNMSLAFQQMLGDEEDDDDKDDDDEIATEQQQQCELKIFPEVGHSETILHLMLGGPTRDVVLTWLQQKS